MRLPDFYVIGAAKAGTTTLYSILSQHPDVFMPDRKEPEFFARDERYARGIEDYAALFEGASADQIVGEASTIYSLSPLFPDTAARIRRHTPEARFIYVLREPVSRAFSYYVQIIKNYQNATGDTSVHRTFEEFVLPDRRAGAAPRSKVFAGFDAHLPDVPELCLAGSDYLLQIRAYLEHFPRERMLFLKFEDLLADRAGLLDRISDFLEIGRIGDLGKGAVAKNVSAEHFRSKSDVAVLTRARKYLWPVWWARNLLPPGLQEKARAGFIETFRKSAAVSVPKPMEPATRRELKRRFLADLEELSEITGLDLGDWAQERA